MTAIPKNFGEGGANLSPNGNGTPSLATALRDVAADLSTLKGTAPLAFTPDAALGAFSGAYTPSEMNALQTLVNDLRAELVAMHAREAARAGVTLPTTAL